MTFRLRILLSLCLYAGGSFAAEPPALTTNGRDELHLSAMSSAAAPRQIDLPAGTIAATPSGHRVIALQAARLAVPPGASADAAIPAAALSSKNPPLTEKATVTSDAEPRLAPLLKYLSTQKDVPRATSQCAVLALLEDITFDQWLQFRREEKPTDAPLVEAIDALGILRQILPEKPVRLAQDPDLKIRALRHPGARGKAMQLYGLTLPGDAPPGATPPDLGQLLHTKPGDNCPICRMRSQMQPPASGL